MSPPPIIFRTHCPAFTLLSPPLCVLTLSSSTTVTTAPVFLPCDNDNVLHVPHGTMRVRLQCGSTEHFLTVSPESATATTVDVVLVRSWESDLVVRSLGVAAVLMLVLVMAMGGGFPGGGGGRSGRKSR